MDRLPEPWAIQKGYLEEVLAKTALKGWIAVIAFIESFLLGTVLRRCKCELFFNPHKTSKMGTTWLKES